MYKHKVQISGMHCASCEVLIHKEVSKIPGVKYLEISHKTGVLEIIHDENLDKKLVEDAVCRCGYKTDSGQDVRHAEFSSASDTINKRILKQVQNDNGQVQDDNAKFNHFSLSTDNFLSWLKAGSILVILYYLFTTLSETSFFKNAINISQSNLSLPLAFMVGLVASVSTCLAVVGSIVLGLSASWKQKNVTDSGHIRQAPFNFVQGRQCKQARMTIMPNLVFQAGRISGFFVLGGILGIIGTNFRYNPALSSLLNITVATVIAYLALSMLNLVPAMKSLLSSFSPGLGKKLGTLENEGSYKAVFIMGGLTFFLPCGFTQSMQVLAFSQADFLKSGLIMAAFALGTAPVLLGVGVLGSKAKTLKDPALVKVIAAVLIIFAIFNFNTGLALNGLGGLGELGKLGGSVGVLAKAENGRQVIEMEVNNGGYTPKAFTIKNNVPVEWRINVTALNGCNSTIIVPSLGVQKQLASGLNIINFTPSQVGRLNFSCWMGMIRGYFEVVDSVQIQTGVIPQAQIDQKAIQGGSCGGGSGGCGCGAKKLN